MADPEPIESNEAPDHRKRKTGELNPQAIVNKRSRADFNVGTAPSLDPLFSEFILPLFESHGWIYDQKSSSLRKDLLCLDCAYTVPFIISNPIWTNTFKEIRELEKIDGPSPKRTALISFLVSEIADRALLAQQISDRIEYQAMVEAETFMVDENCKTNGTYDFVPTHSIQMDRGVAIQKSDRMKRNATASYHENITSTGVKKIKSVILPNDDVDRRKYDTVADHDKSRECESPNVTDENIGMKGLDIPDEPDFNISSDFSYPTSDHFIGITSVDALWNDPEKPMLPDFEEKIDTTLEEIDSRSFLKDMDLTDSSAGIKSTFVRATKRLPKILSNTQGQLEPWILNVDQIIEEACGGIQGKSAISIKSLIHAQVEDATDDPSTQILSIEGRKDMVDLVNHFVTKEVIRSVADFNHKKLMDDERSIRLQVRLDITKDLGFSVSRGNKSNAGLWLKHIDPGKQLGRILGLTGDRGVVLISVGGETVTKVSDKKRIVDQALAKYARTHKQRDKNLVFQLCLHRSINPNTVRAENLVINKKGAQTQKIDECDIDSSGNDISSNKKPNALNYDPIEQTKKPSNTQYVQFVDKVRIARDLEFTAGLKYCKKINSMMWARHKYLFGEKCDNICPCLRHLNDLTQNIVQNCEEENLQHTLNERSGFISCFIEKFSSKVRKEFPLFSDQELLSKLVNMWDVHKAERRFGLKCTKLCTCGEGWNKMIQSSVNPSANNTVQAHKPLIRKTSDETKLTLVFPCKNPLGFYVETVSSESSQTGESYCVVKSIAPTCQSKKLRVGAVVTSAAQFASSTGHSAVPIQSHLQLKDMYYAAKLNNAKIILCFDNTFEPGPNERGPSNEWSDHSAWLQDERDGWAGGSPLVNNNVNIAALKRDSSVQQVPELRDISLRKWPEIVPVQKSSNSTMNMDVRSIRRDVSTAGLHTARSSEHIGLSVQRFLEAHDAPLKSNLVKSSDQSSPQSPPFQSQHKKSSERSTLSNSKSLYDSPKSSDGIVHNVLKSQKVKKVHFASSEHLCQYYSIPCRGSEAQLLYEIPEHNPNAISVVLPLAGPPSNALRAATIDNDIPAQKRRAKRLLRSLEEGTLHDLITVLNDGINPDDPIDGDDSALDFAKKRLRQVSSGGIDERGSKFSLKIKILKIWLKARYAIDIARYADESKCIQFLPQLVDGIVLTPLAQEANISQLVTCSAESYNADGSTELRSLPPLPLQTSINWSSTDFVPFSCCYNHKIDRYRSSSGKQLVIYFEQGNNRQKVKLGSWRENLDAIDSWLDDRSKTLWTPLVRDMVPSNYMSEGCMTVKFRRVACNDKYLSKKRQEATDNLIDISKWIDSAQRDCLEAINIASLVTSRSDSVNLLHAAVYLRDFHLVSTFLQQGCDSQMKAKNIGTPLDLACNLVEKAFKKCDPNLESLHEIIRLLKNAHLSINSKRRGRQDEYDHLDSAVNESLSADVKPTSNFMIDENQSMNIDEMHGNRCDDEPTSNVLDMNTFGPLCETNFPLTADAGQNIYQLPKPPLPVQFDIADSSSNTGESIVSSDSPSANHENPYMKPEIDQADSSIPVSESILSTVNCDPSNTSTNQRSPSVGRGRGRVLPAWMTQRESESFRRQQNEESIMSQSDLSTQELSRSMVQASPRPPLPVQFDIADSSSNTGESIVSSDSPSANHENPYMKPEIDQADSSIPVSESILSTVNCDPGNTSTNQRSPSVGRGRGRVLPAWMTQRESESFRRQQNEESIMSQSDLSTQELDQTPISIPYADQASMSDGPGSRVLVKATKYDLHRTDVDPKEHLNSSLSTKRDIKKAWVPPAFIGKSEKSSCHGRSTGEQISSEQISHQKEACACEYYSKRNDGLCRFFGAVGGCKYGSSCSFAHNAVSHNEEESEHYSKKNDVRCRFFGSLGGCQYGSSCNFAHVTDTSSKSNYNSTNEK